MAVPDINVVSLGLEKAGYGFEESRLAPFCFVLERDVSWDHIPAGDGHSRVGVHAVDLEAMQVIDKVHEQT